MTTFRPARDRRGAPGVRRALEHGHARRGVRRAAAQATRARPAPPLPPRRARGRDRRLRVSRGRRTRRVGASSRRACCPQRSATGHRERVLESLPRISRRSGSSRCRPTSTATIPGRSPSPAARVRGGRQAGRAGEDHRRGARRRPSRRASCSSRSRSDRCCCGAYDLALEGYADLATYAPVTITLDDWLDGEEATCRPDRSSRSPARRSSATRVSAHARRQSSRTGSRSCAAGGAGGGSPRRSSGAKLAWAAANGVSEIVTWTQRGNEGMRALNERLGYAYRSVSISVLVPLE